MNEAQFSQAEYLTTFTTFIYGYVATRFLSGWSSMITHRRSIALSKEHLLWTILTFFLLIDIWWTSWRKTATVADDNLIFYSTLITPFIFYLLSHFLFPDLNHLLGKNLKTFLTPAFRKIMVVMALLLLSFLLNDWIFNYRLRQNTIFISLGVVLAVAILVFHAALLFRRLVLLVSFTLLGAHLYFLLGFKPPYSDIDGFSFVEYITVFITFIYGFVAWRFLEGWGAMIDNFKKLNIGYDYLPWTVVGFLLMLDIWWSTWAREGYLSTSILHFFLALLVPILFYFFSSVILPLELLNRGFLKINFYYFRNKKAVCFLLGLILVSNGVLVNMLEGSVFWSSENLLRFIGIGLAVSGIVSPNLFVHRTILVLGLIAIIIHALTV
jgi:hypothetical protein